MEDLGTVCPFVQILDLPVPQTVDYVADALRLLDRPMVEEVIALPKISCSPCPSRSRVPEPQSAEQLVEVPTVLTPTRIAVQIAEHIVGIPVPHGFGGKRRLQGLLPEQSSTATSSSLERISERTVEQIVDIPSSGRGLRQDSSSSAGLADEDFTGFFSHFSPWGKSAASAAVPSPQPSRVRACPPVSAHGLGRLMRTLTLPTSRRHSRTRTRSSCLRKKRTRAAGGHLQPPRVVPFTGIGARAGLCGISLLGPPRGGGRGGEEDQVDLRSSSTPAVAYAGLVWLVASCALFPVVVYTPEMLRIMAGMHQKDSCPRRTGYWIIWEMTSLRFRLQRNASSPVVHAMRQFWAGSWKSSTILFVKGHTRLLRSILVLSLVISTLLFILFFTAPCFWQPLVRCSAEEYRIIFSASWFDSGYMLKTSAGNVISVQCSECQWLKQLREAKKMKPLWKVKGFEKQTSWNARVLDCVVFMRK